MLRWPNGQRQATLCLMLSPLTSFLARPVQTHLPNLLPRPYRSSLFCSQVPPGPCPTCINLPAGGWLGRGPCEQGTGCNHKCEMMSLWPRAKGRWAYLETEMPPAPGSLPSEDVITQKADVGGGNPCLTLVCTVLSGSFIHSAALKLEGQSLRVTVHTCYSSMWEGGCDKRTQGLRTNWTV